MIKFGYKTAMIKGLTRDEQLAFAKELGLAEMEVNSGDIANENDVAEWRGLSEKYGVLIKSAGVGMNLCNPVYEGAITNSIKKKAKLAKQLDFRMIFTRTLSPSIGVPQKDTWKYTIRKVKEFADICEDAGVRFALEIDHGCFIDSMERALTLFHYVNQDNLYLNYDPTNIYIGGGDPVLAIAAAKDKIVGGHIKDAIYRTEYKGETTIGCGEIDYAAIFRELNRQGTDITLHYEHLKDKDEVRAAHQYIQGIFSSVSK